MESCLYEFGFHLHWNDLLKLCAFILPAIIWFFSGSIENLRWLRILIKIISLCLSLLILWSLYIFPIVQYQTIKNDINDGTILVVEGEVSDFLTPENSFGGHATESFRIGDVVFSYSNTSNFGYCQFRCNGGVIKDNGQKLKIEYYTDSLTGENIICNIYEIQ